MAEAIPRINLLFSYAYWSGPKDTEVIQTLRDTSGDAVGKVMIDSGAFTAYTLGETIELSDYERWLREIDPVPDHYFTLDVIANPRETLVNYRAMRARGLTPIPIATFNAPSEHVAEYLANGYIAVGGISRMSFQQLRQFGKPLIRRIQEHEPHCNLHLLGVGKPKVISRYLPDSTDATSFMVAARYGKHYMFHNGGLHPLGLKSQSGRIASRTRQRILGRSLPAHGFDTWEEALSYERTYGLLTTRAYILYALHLKRVHDIDFYFAISPSNWLGFIVREYRIMRDQGLLHSPT